MDNSAVKVRTSKRGHFNMSRKMRLALAAVGIAVLGGAVLFFAALQKDYLNTAKFFFVVTVLILAVSVGAFVYHALVTNEIMRKIYEKVGIIAKQNNLFLPAYKKMDPAQFENVLTMLDDLSVTIQKDYSLQILQKQAHLDALQNQINPHFLYNALDSIRGLALEQGAEETADMTEALASFFRFSISKTNDFISLSQELANTENYIKIQKYRFSNRFELRKEIEISDEQLEEYKVPKLMLQPIIENSLNHGLADMTANGVITIRITDTQSRLLISISDNGSGMDDNLLRSLNQRFQEPHLLTSPTDKGGRRSGIALMNINSRLKLLFGNRFGLTAYSTKGVGTEIQIAIPLNH